MTGAVFAVAALVGSLFVIAGVEDARTQQVSIRIGRTTTVVAIVGLGAIGLIATEWTQLVQALVGALLVTGIQVVPYLLQSGRRSGQTGEWIGRADVRFGVPFGWTLGWFGVGFAVVGFAVALVAGLIASAVTGRRRIPFVPYLAVGLWAGLAWALARSLAGGA
ncbi:MAG: hypothetical protein OEV40_18490 [Acidimicrobiia bacterium]|nr:hypothetical protein [Acidimicrobiia bacterium]